MYLASSPLFVKMYIYLFAKERLITDEQNIVVSGPPRVSNTFVGRVLYMNQDNLHFVNHFHSSGQVINALERDVPAIVIIREPVDTAVSLCIKYPLIYPWVAVWRYNIYYKRLMTYKNKYVLVDFQTIKNDFNGLIKEFNYKYKDRLVLNTIDDFKKLEKEVLNSMLTKGLPEGDLETQVSAPTKKKEKLKAGIRKIVDNQFNINKAKILYKNMNQK